MSSAAFIQSDNNHLSAELEIQQGTFLCVMRGVRTINSHEKRFREKHTLLCEFICILTIIRDDYCKCRFLIPVGDKSNDSLQSSICTDRAM
jgi:hypothetical protein